MKIKKIVAVITTISIIFGLYSATYAEEIKLKKGLYHITNPYSYSNKIFNEKGDIILMTSSMDNGYLQIVSDEYNNKDICMIKTITGEKKIVSTYSDVDGNEYTYEYPSSRTVIYDIDGKEMKDLPEGLHNVIFGLGDYVYYYADNMKYAYNLKTKEVRPIEYDAFDSAFGKLILSNNAWNNHKDEIYIYDKDFNFIKKIDGYRYDYTYNIGTEKYIRISTESNINDNMKQYYNYLDKDFLFVFDEPITSNIYSASDDIVTCTRDKVEFDYDFKNRKVVGELREAKDDENDRYKMETLKPEEEENIRKQENKYEYIEKRTYEGKTIYLADYYERDSDEKVTYHRDIYNMDFEKISDNIINVQAMYNSGYLIVNQDTIVDYDLNEVKKFDRKSYWQENDKFGKTFFSDSCDENYYSRDKFDVYDSDFNIVFKDIKRMNTYVLDDYIVIVDDEGTKLYDKDMKLTKLIDRQFEFWKHENKGTVYYNFRDLETDLVGIMDKDFNVIIDRLKYIGEMREDYFTYRNGFKYGFMDYKGNVLISFSIFDNMNEESGEDPHKYDYMY